MKILAKLLPLLIISIACSKNDDELDPDYSGFPSVSVQYPFPNDTAHADGPFPMLLFFEDDKHLDSIEIVIGKKPLGGIPYYYFKEKYSRSKVTVKENDINIPKHQGWEGEHYMYVRCLDNEGNETAKIARTFYYTDEDIMKPHLSGQAYNLFNTSSGNQVQVSIMASDYRNLKKTNIALVDSNYKKLEAVEFTPDSAFFYTVHYFTRPSELKKGDIYRFQFSATDSAGNRVKQNDVWHRVQ